MSVDRVQTKVYLAGPSAELDRVFRAIGALTAAGHLVTEPWWARIDEAARRGWQHDSEVPPEYMTESAERNRRGIQEADVLIALARSTGGFSSGCAGEIGYALAERDGERGRRMWYSQLTSGTNAWRTPVPVLRKRIILVGDCKGFVWSWLVPSEDRVASMVEALALLAAR